MKLSPLILSLIVLLIGCTNIHENKNRTKDRKYRNYDFTIIISVEKSENDFDYIINRHYFVTDKSNKILLHEDKLLEQTFYEYKTNKENNNTDKIAVETKRFQLDNQQLDKLYLLTAKLFSVDSLNLVNDTTRYDYNYDGYYAEITLSKLNTTYKIRLNGVSEKSILEDYKNLLSNIENMKVESYHKSIEKKKTKDD